MQTKCTPSKLQRWNFFICFLNIFVEFWPESKSPFYSIPTGDNSCYYDESLAVLTSLANTGSFDFQDMCEEFSKQLGPGSPYSAELREEYMLRRRLGQPLTPLLGKWLSGSMLKCLENRQAVSAFTPSEPNFLNIRSISVRHRCEADRFWFKPEPPRKYGSGFSCVQQFSYNNYW